jgi:hypothetical protein
MVESEILFISKYKYKLWSRMYVAFYVVEMLTILD